MKRWMLVRDDDCHNYLIPADKSDAFYVWLDASEADWENYEGEDFNQYRISGFAGVYSFTDPQEMK